MFYLNNLCSLCLVQNKKFTSRSNIDSNAKDMLERIIPEFLQQTSGIQKKLCDECLGSLTILFEFRRKCLENISIFDEYIRKLQSEHGSYRYLAITITDIKHDIKRVNDKDIILNEDSFCLENDVRTDWLQIDDNIEQDNSCNRNRNEEQEENDQKSYVAFDIKAEISEEVILNEHTCILEDDYRSNCLKLVENIKPEHCYNREPSEEQDGNNGKRNVTLRAPFENDNIFECETCKLTFSSPIYLKSHVPRCRNRVISRIPVTTNGQLQNDGSGDLQECVQKTGSDCCIPQKTSKQFNQTERHTSDNSSKKLYPCDVCNKSYSYRSNLKTHERLHSGINLHICNVCDKAFAKSSDLLRHKRIHSGEKPYTCDLCKKSFTQFSNLLTHKRIHSGEKPYTCDLCKKSFTQFSNLLTHKRIHSGEKLYTCDLCKKSFTQFSNLLTHKRIHSGEKPYTCDLCKKSFAHSGHLTIHHRVHTKERPYMCKVCQKSFAQVPHLKGHMRIHTGEKPYA